MGGVKGGIGVVRWMGGGGKREGRGGLRGRVGKGGGVGSVWLICWVKIL